MEWEGRNVNTVYLHCVFIVHGFVIGVWSWSTSFYTIYVQPVASLKHIFYSIESEIMALFGLGINKILTLTVLRFF